MNILIIGCSYGVPNYGPGLPHPTDHIEFLLKDRGHVVHNSSMNGASNLEVLERTQTYLQGVPITNHIGKNIQYTSSENLDLVIWFHTETCRDSEHPFIVYSRYAKFFNELNTQVAVIGGYGDVLPEFLEFYKPDFLIQSWRRIILSETIPLTNTLSATELVHTSMLKKEDRLKIFEDNIVILDLMKQSPHFYDGHHPGAWPHRDLVDRLINAKLIT